MPLIIEGVVKNGGFLYWQFSFCGSSKEPSLHVPLVDMPLIIEGVVKFGGFYIGDFSFKMPIAKY